VSAGRHPNSTGSLNEREQVGSMLGLECFAPEEVLERVTGSKTDDAG
jgi:hypothetical protein